MIQFDYDDGASTRANTASMGLCLWLGHNGPMVMPENPQPFEVYVGKSIPGPKDSEFMTAVIAAIERTFGTGPTTISHRVYRSTADDAEFEAGCVDILKWLEEYGDIRNLSGVD